MSINLVGEIKSLVEKIIDSGKRGIVIYPYGDVGLQIKTILSEIYGIHDLIILDNHLCRYNPNIKDIGYLDYIDKSTYGLILASTNHEIYSELMESVLKYWEEKDINELDSMKQSRIAKKNEYPELTTMCGKYSYGPLCKHRLIEKIGAFCSFAIGTDVVVNHPCNYISTHPMLYKMDNVLGECGAERYYKEFKEKYYPKGLVPKGVREVKKISIGNDVWLGRNVIITNYANIGNGVIAGAGAVITKDVPDYAIVAGVPARIIKYRYNKEQIEALNRIAWWDWDDELIVERHEDFLGSIEDFIEKYDR